MNSPVKKSSAATERRSVTIVAPRPIVVARPPYYGGPAYRGPYRGGYYGGGYRSYGYRGGYGPYRGGYGPYRR